MTRRVGRARLATLAALATLATLAGGALACHNEVQHQPVSLAEVALPGTGRIATPAARPAADPLHVVILSIDTLRADHLSAYGYPRETSPALDALAARGVLFERAYSQSPKTAESHMTLLTGLYPDAHGVRNWSERNERLSDEIPTLARLLRRAGYRTEGFVGGANVRAELGFDQGFDVYEVAWGAERLFARASRALEEIAAAEAAGARRPTFLFLHTLELHDPYTPPDDYAARFTDPGYTGEIVHSEKALYELAGDGGWSKLQSAFWDRVDADDPDDVQHLRDLYDALIRYTDDRLAGFLDRLRELGLDERTLVVVLSDHGEAFGERAGFRHNTVYQEVLHVPLILQLPGARESGLAGRRIGAPVRLADVLPTLLERLGLEIPGHVQGRSLLALLGEGEAQPRWVLSQWRHTGQRALRVDEWKYVRRDGGDELYQLAADAGEENDVARRYPDVVARLRGDSERLAAKSLGLQESAGAGPSFGLDAATREELQALGYLVEGQGN